VLRARPGDQVVVLDNSGIEYLVTLQSLSREQAQGVVVSKSPGAGEPRARITLYQGVLKSDKFELVLQKGTEVGISSFIPVFCARSIPRASEKEWAASRLTRWQRIIREAAEQSRRGRIPTLAKPVEFSAACDAAQGMDLIPWEQEHAVGLKTTLQEWKARLNEAVQPNAPALSISIFIGPEGGFTAEEVDYARARGIAPVSLGNRILRAETAGIVTAAAILYELGELGG